MSVRALFPAFTARYHSSRFFHWLRIVTNWLFAVFAAFVILVGVWFVREAFRVRRAKAFAAELTALGADARTWGNFPVIVGVMVTAKDFDDAAFKRLVATIRAAEWDMDLRIFVQGGSVPDESIDTVWALPGLSEVELADIRVSERAFLHVPENRRLAISLRRVAISDDERQRLQGLVQGVYDWE